MNAYKATLAAVQKVWCEGGMTCSWTLADHLAWYYHCKERGPDYFHKRWGNHKATPSRNKREGRSVGHRVRSRVIGGIKYTVSGRAPVRVLK